MSNNHLSSPEFATLCQSQITLLAESLGAVWSVVYLAEDVIEDGETTLFPLATYPPTESCSLPELPTVKLSEVWQQLQSHSLTQLSTKNLVEDERKSQIDPQSEFAERKQIILPLMHQETFIGLLVTGREDREWRQAELKQLEKIALSLAIARFIELQYRWTQDELSIQENLRRAERDRLDNLIHQLRNPLTALRTFSKLLLKRVLPGDRNHKVAKSLLEQSDRFQQLLQQFEAESAVQNREDYPNLLLESGSNNSSSNFLLPGLKGELDSINLSTILEPLLNTAKAIAVERKISLEDNLPPTLPQVKGDFSALREIFNNLIDNSLKYTPSGGRVAIDLEKKTSMLGIAIQDTGYGIPKADRERIFERHYRGIQAESNIPGTGLGLAIAKELTVRMEGTIELISPNNLAADYPGTTFIVWLTLAN
ncbi:MAG: ATP-binding protein [Cyanobacteria bacterium P01_G01_bin.19]